jgi:hypothetical protein
MTITQTLSIKALTFAIVLAFGTPLFADDAASPASSEPAPPASPIDSPIVPPPPQDAVPAPNAPAAPAEEPNRSRRAISTHQRTVSEDGNTVRREHTVTNPTGTMVQTFERTRSADGDELHRVQTWTAPDGTVRRQHEWWTKLNPFRSSGENASSSTTSGGRRSGFTVGANRGLGGWNGHRNGLAKDRAGDVEPPGREASRSIAARAERDHGAASGHGGNRSNGGGNRR